MQTTIDTLAAICKLAIAFCTTDGEGSDLETDTIYDFLSGFEGVTPEIAGQVIRQASEMEAREAFVRTICLAEEDKERVSNFFADIICADAQLTPEEEEYYHKVCITCGLPDILEERIIRDESPEAAPAEVEDTEIYPSFVVIDFRGNATYRWVEQEDWDTLHDEMCTWIQANQIEVVRYTKPLNALSKQLELVGKHLVFLTSRNGFTVTVGDNMTATLLYGGDYELFGNIIIALETDDGYEIEGFKMQSHLDKAFLAVDEAVGGLLSLK